MMSNMKSNLSIFALVLAAAGCGGSAGGGTSGGGATDESGNVITTAGGEAVSEAAHNAWTEAMAEFSKYEEAGWNESACDSVFDAFGKANERQGGRFAEAIYMGGLTKSRCKKMDEAKSAYTRALSVNDKLCGARVGMGVFQLEEGKRQEAFQTFQQALKGDPRCTQAYVNLAVLQRERGGAQVAEALNNLRRAMAIEARYLPAFNEMALLYLEQAKQNDNDQMLDLAGVVCRQAQLIDANYAPIYNTWGLVAVEQGNVIEALRFFERAIRLDDSLYEAHMNFGQITISFRGYEDAKTSFEKATQLKPGSYEAHIGLGAALRGLGKVDEAEAQYKKAIELDGNKPQAYFNLGLLYQDFKSGGVEDLERAQGFYNQFIQKARGDEELKATVRDLQRSCDNSKRSRRRKSTDCRPGRLQNISTAVEALKAAAEMQRQMEQRAQQQGAQ